MQNITNLGELKCIQLENNKLRAHAQLNFCGKNKRYVILKYAPPPLDRNDGPYTHPAP